MRQFSQLTTTRNSSRHSRGSISILAVVWCGLTALGTSTIVMATTVVQQRAFLQSNADGVALAFVQRGIVDAERLATAMGVSLTSADMRDGVVTVTISNQYGSSRASATR